MPETTLLPLQKMKRFDFARKSSFLFLANNASSVIQYVFQMMMVRMLTDPQFALMNTLFNMMSLVGVPAAAFQMDLTRRTVMAAKSLDVQLGLRMAQQALRRITPYCVAVLLALYFMRGWMAAFFNTRDVQAVGWTVMGALIPVMGALCLGFFSGMQWFRLMGILGLVMTIMRVLLGYALAELGMGASAGVIATLAVGLIPLTYFGW